MTLFNGMLLFIHTETIFSKQRDLVVIMCYNHVYLQQKKSASNHKQNEVIRYVKDIDITWEQNIWKERTWSTSFPKVM